LNGQRIAARETGAALPIAELGMKFLSEDRRADVLRRVEGAFVIAPFVRCAAEQYPRIALGQNDIALFERSLPWDHAPGALFVEEAGAVIRRPDGSGYRVGDGRRGLIAASSQRMWDRAASVLFG
jgi:fructose-1,6-bisphosphatase/inositol monophosphatase family enzyme